MLATVILLFVLAFVIYFWYNHTRMKEIAFEAAQAYCQSHHYQLLDDTIALHKIRWLWREGACRRVFVLDYFDQAHDERRHVFIVMHKQSIIKISCSSTGDNVVQLAEFKAKRKG